MSLSWAIALAIFVATQASATRVPPLEDHARTRRYVENLRDSLAYLPAGCVLSAGRVPGFVVHPGSEPFNDIGRFVRLLSPKVETAVDELAPCYVTAGGTIEWTRSRPGHSSVEALPMELAGELYGGVRFNATAGWTPNGAYPDTGPVPLDGPTYGSWSGSDANTGTLRISSISLTEPTSRLAVPFVTGPEVRDLALVLTDKGTGEVLVQLEPPPRVPMWRVIQLDFPRRPAGTELEIVVTDGGAGWGQWLAVGAPRRVQSR